MEFRKQMAPAARAALRLGLVAAALAALGACASIPQRAWRNGEALSYSRAYQEVLSGNTTFATRRQLEDALNPMQIGYYQRAYVPFTQWW